MDTPNSEVVIKEDKKVPRNKRKSVSIEENLMKKVRLEIERSLDRIATENGLSHISLEKMSYDENGFSAKLEGYSSIVAKNGKPLSRANLEWNKFCELYDMLPDDFGETVM
jgi:hypothetical protein